MDQSDCASRSQGAYPRGAWVRRAVVLVLGAMPSARTERRRPRRALFAAVSVLALAAMYSAPPRASASATEFVCKTDGLYFQDLNPGSSGVTEGRGAALCGGSTDGTLERVDLLFTGDYSAASCPNAEVRLSGRLVGTPVNGAAPWDVAAELVVLGTGDRPAAGLDPAGTWVTSGTAAFDSSQPSALSWAYETWPVPAFPRCFVGDQRVSHYSASGTFVVDDAADLAVPDSPSTPADNISGEVLGVEDGSGDTVVSAGTSDEGTAVTVLVGDPAIAQKVQAGEMTLTEAAAAPRVRYVICVISFRRKVRDRIHYDWGGRVGCLERVNFAGSARLVLYKRDTITVDTGGRLDSPSSNSYSGGRITIFTKPRVVIYLDVAITFTRGDAVIGVTGNDSVNGGKSKCRARGNEAFCFTRSVSFPKR